MMTDAMQLNSMTDASTWAQNMGNLSDAQQTRLANWIWENKPEIGCRYDEHPIYNIEDGFWEIVGDEAEGQEELL